MWLAVVLYVVKPCGGASVVRLRPPYQQPQVEPAREEGEARSLGSRLPCKALIVHPARRGRGRWQGETRRPAFLPARIAILWSAASRVAREQQNTASPQAGRAVPSGPSPTPVRRGRLAWRKMIHPMLCMTVAQVGKAQFFSRLPSSEGATQDSLGCNRPSSFVLRGRVGSGLEVTPPRLPNIDPLRPLRMEGPPLAAAMPTRTRERAGAPATRQSNSDMGWMEGT